MRGTSTTNTYGNETYSGGTGNAYDGFGNNSDKLPIAVQQFMAA